MDVRIHVVFAGESVFLGENLPMPQRGDRISWEMEGTRIPCGRYRVGDIEWCINKWSPHKVDLVLESI